MARKKCSHVKHMRNVEPSANGCEDCLKTVDKWVELRICLARRLLQFIQKQARH